MLRSMHTMATVSTARHTTLRIPTEASTQFIDITDEVEELIAAAAIRDGIINIQTLHTTTAIVLNEHEPLLLSDFRTLLARAAPRAAFYRHDDMEARTVNLSPGERANGHSHCRAILLGASASLNIVGGRLQRGCWQRVFFVELDGPRDRDVSVMLIGDSAR